MAGGLDSEACFQGRRAAASGGGSSGGGVGGSSFCLGSSPLAASGGHSPFPWPQIVWQKQPVPTKRRGYSPLLR